MQLLSCPVCGGKLNIRIGSEYAACDSCGNVTKIDPAEAERLATVYRSAERSMRLNSVEGYEAALRELDTISFIEEARKKHADCEKRLRDLQADPPQAVIYTHDSALPFIEKDANGCAIPEGADYTIPVYQFFCENYEYDLTINEGFRDAWEVFRRK